MRLVSCLIIIILPAALFAGSRQLFSYKVQPGSQITISGSTNVSQFACFSGTTAPHDFFQVEFATGSEVLRFSNANFNIQVVSFDCGNRLMNRDMHQAMGVDKNPLVSIQIIEGIPLEHDQKTGSGTARLQLSITLNGVTRQAIMPVEYSGVYGSRVSVTGTKRLRMSYFGITPPTPALGLVNVRDEVAISMKLLLNINLISKTSSGQDYSFNP